MTKTKGARNIPLQSISSYVSSAPAPKGDGALPIERPVHLSGSAVRSRGATHKGRE